MIKCLILLIVIVDMVNMHFVVDLVELYSLGVQVSSVFY